MPNPTDTAQAKAEMSNYVVNKSTGCWNWTGYIEKEGYGQVWLKSEHGTRRPHRIEYENKYGPIPSGMVLDHLCRNRSCVNPEHLEIVSHRENILRGEGITAQNAKKTQCLRGHPFSGENLRTQFRKGKPERVCKACQHLLKKAWRERRKP